MRRPPNNNDHDFQNSWGFNFSRFNSNGWSNLNMFQASQDPSILPLQKQTPPQQPSNLSQGLCSLPIINQPPQPTHTLFKCIENENQDQQEIKEVSYFMDNEVETKRVNHKQYFRIMKRRIKKVLNKYSQSMMMNLPPAQNGDLNQCQHQKIGLSMDSGNTAIGSYCNDRTFCKSQIKRESGIDSVSKKYMYQSRHRHATNRVRGKDGKFLATRPQQQRFREKKKRGRKPKNYIPPTNDHNQPSPKQSTPTKL